jgi:hypothetical protein
MFIIEKRFHFVKCVRPSNAGCLSERMCVLTEDTNDEAVDKCRKMHLCPQYVCVCARVHVSIRVRARSVRKISTSHAMPHYT